MVPNYERILQIAVEDGIEKGLYSLEKTDIENLNEDELITILTDHVMGEIVEWLYWRT